jgi:hypothetical protein
VVVVVVRPIHGVCIIRNFRGDGGKSLSEKDGAREVAGVVRYIYQQKEKKKRKITFNQENHSPWYYLKWPLRRLVGSGN